MPEGHQSELVRRLRRQLAESFLKQAQARAGNDPFKAAPYALKAYEQNPGDPDVVEMVTTVEAATDAYIGKGCAGLRKAKQVLRPSSAKTTEVKRQWDKLGCK